MAYQNTELSEETVWVTNPAGSSSVVLVCEHASNDIPAQHEGLGPSPDDQENNAASDPGAMAVAEWISKQLDAALITSRVSRLVYDCNRPPDAPDALPARSEAIDIPGNANLSQPEREARVDAIYRPFQSALAELVKHVTHPVIVTMHRFTPVYFGQNRSVEIGILHDNATRLADAMLEIRNDLIKTGVRQKAMADVISGWLIGVFGHTQKPGNVQCRA